MWLSFADVDGFRGIVILRAKDIVEAVQIANRLGINPGGQVMACEMPPTFHVPEEATGKLLSRADCDRLFPDAGCKSISEHEADANTHENLIGG